jgi:transposase-like protein
VLQELSVVEQRYDAVMEVLRDGLSVSEVARRYGVSRQSLHAWVRRYEADGLKGLSDRSTGPGAALTRSRRRWRPGSVR